MISGYQRNQPKSSESPNIPLKPDNSQENQNNPTGIQRKPNDHSAIPEKDH
ncbi:hypothetical protein DPMN_099075 [Dreissena polymorpha]|uniref:Uncharacterized protein n=1 Tax=Dreissena polymorpha TaxID=45954 RepID=A0A9D4FV94_DREPO|nr:hypothetical protein DPMN_157014 [Dreissena polymorpha]KAH3856485.1 hypothetical protein DPMN_099075 [Dreissena polymorpha]